MVVQYQYLVPLPSIAQGGRDSHSQLLYIICSRFLINALIKSS